MNKHRTTLQDALAVRQPVPHARARQNPMHREAAPSPSGPANPETPNPPQNPMHRDKPAAPRVSDSLTFLWDHNFSLDGGFHKCYQ